MEGKGVVLIGLLLATLAIFTANPRAEAARKNLPVFLDAFSAGTRDGENCCDNCVCTLSECMCGDIYYAASCPPACGLCICTLSYPPGCRCVDINPSYCHTPCTESRKAVLSS
ncbi:Bowman-Birk type trypsin inhibitor-like [Nymphaea colorata]|nr:Bowman-Birk type trypsin inhibitor-like [Nymphaea colorata]